MLPGRTMSAGRIWISSMASAGDDVRRTQDRDSRGQLRRDDRRSAISRGIDGTQALAEIVANRGSQFSPRIVDALLRLHERGYLDGTSHRHDSAAA